MGEFSRTQMWWNGKPVFRNSLGLLLHQTVDKGWGVGEKLGYKGLAGSMGHHCPSSEEKWTYFYGSK